MRKAAAFLLVLTAAFSLGAQVLPPQESLMPEEYEPEEFPVWTHDLRRFEIITVGSFPVTFFATALIYDFSWYAANDFDPSYAMGSRREKDDIGIIMGAAAGASLVIATVDMIVNISRRKKAGKEEDEQRRVPGSDS